MKAVILRTLFRFWCYGVVLWVAVKLSGSILSFESLASLFSVVGASVVAFWDGVSYTKARVALGKG